MSVLSQLSRPVAVRALIGPTSSGRSTLLRTVVARQAPEVIPVCISGPERYRNGIIRSVLRALGSEANGPGRQKLREQCRTALLDARYNGKSLLFVVDNAHEIGPAAFSELIDLLLHRRQAAGGADILLTLDHIDGGSSPAADYLRAQQAPEIAVVSWLSATEIHWYLKWRLGRCGLQDLFSAAAIELIARSSQGSFAAINTLCQIALLLLKQTGVSQVDDPLVRHALQRLRDPQARLPAAPASDARPARKPESIQLTISRDGTVLHQLLGADRILIGRSKLNDLRLDDRYLSRHHLVIVRRSDGYHVSDLNSANGSYLNGKKVDVAQLHHGDVICAGQHRIAIALPASQQQPDRSRGAEHLDRTEKMPAPNIPEPARLKVVK